VSLNSFREKEIFPGGVGDLVVELVAAAVDLLDRHGSDRLAHLAFEDVRRHVADSVLADPEELLGRDPDGGVGGIDLDLGHGVGQDGHAAVSQHFGGADGQGDDFHGQDVHGFHEGHDERPSAQAVAVADLLFRPVGPGDGFLASGDDQGLVRADLLVLLGHDQGKQAEHDDDGADQDQQGYQTHGNLLGLLP
jgi:hypothetical protein